MSSEDMENDIQKIDIKEEITTNLSLNCNKINIIDEIACLKSLKKSHVLCYSTSTRIEGVSRVQTQLRPLTPTLNPFESLSGCLYLSISNIEFWNLISCLMI
ncbi:hypothetical protein L9F63_023599, partial [Diploptera punctata]